MKYIWPKLSNRDFAFFRIGGAGLANCMFVAARAYIYSKKNNIKFIDPTWRKFSIGPFIRREKDKRIYNELFRNIGINGLTKLLLITFKRSQILYEEGLKNYFLNLQDDYDLVKEYFDRICKESTISLIDKSKMRNKVAVHVRLGDYSESSRIPITWYKSIIENIKVIDPTVEFALFSDGTDDELTDLLTIDGLKREFYGNAYADMYAISLSKLLIASDSTFSAWGAFLGNVPIIFNRRHFPPVYKNEDNEYVLGDSTLLPEQIKNILQINN